MKWYRCSFDYVLDKLSYANFIMYGAVIPSFGGSENEVNGGGGQGETLSADKPEDWDKIRKFYRRRKR